MEFALLAPVLFLLVIGIINFSILLSQQLALNNGVRQGVRMAVVAGNTANQTCSQAHAGIKSATGPAIALNQSNVSIRLAQVQSSNGSTTNFECFSGGGGGFPTYVTTTTGQANASDRICAESPAGGTDRSVRADVRYPGVYLISMPFMPTITLKATAVYRCEFVS